MQAHDVVLVLVGVTALAFDFTNGIHDTANAMATSIAKQALRPKGRRSPPTIRCPTFGALMIASTINLVAGLDK
jgi:hypothetical protein